MNYSPNGPHDDSQIVSLLSREQYFWFPSDSFLLDYPLLIWLHAKDMTIIFFFFNFKRNLQPQNEKTTPRFNMYWCRKHTENWPYLCKSQVKVSFLFDEWIWAFLATKLCQSINLLPVSALREEISSVICPIMVWWLMTILYRIENRSLRGIEPTQVLTWKAC